MRTYLKFITLIFLFAAFSTAKGQYLTNPSFEGEPGIGVCPGSWIPANSNSSPDTEPLDCDNSLSPSDGSTYITLVTRGDSANYPNSVENAVAQLNTPLLPNFCYTFTIDIASRNDVGFFTWENGFTAYDSPTKLIVYAGSTAHDKGEVIYESGPVPHSGWQTQSFVYKPGSQVNFITLEAAYTGFPGNGNISIDNLRIEENAVYSKVITDTTVNFTDLPLQLNAENGNNYQWTPTTGLSCTQCQSPLVTDTISKKYNCLFNNFQGCPVNNIFNITFIGDTANYRPPQAEEDLFIPNVFTPNNDGFNDYFHIKALKPLSALIVFDSGGRMVYKNENYNNEWDGRDIDGTPLPEGTYWYVLQMPGLKNIFKGYVYIKNE